MGGAGGITWGPETSRTRVHGPGWAACLEESSPQDGGVPSEGDRHSWQHLVAGAGSLPSKEEVPALGESAGERQERLSAASGSGALTGSELWPTHISRQLEFASRTSGLRCLVHLHPFPGLSSGEGATLSEAPRTLCCTDDAHTSFPAEPTAWVPTLGPYHVFPQV